MVGEETKRLSRANKKKRTCKDKGEKRNDRDRNSEESR